jgi:hypothetical protein
MAQVHAGVNIMNVSPRLAIQAMRRLLRHLLKRKRRTPPPSPHDPFAWTPALLRPRPHSGAGSVAVAEPDED